MTRDEMEQEFRASLAPHFPAGVPEGLVRSLMLAAGGYTATQVEQRARSPLSQLGPARRRERSEGKRTA